MQHICTMALQSTCRRAESVFCSSAAWLLPAQYFSESGDGQQRETLLGQKAPRPSCTFPITWPLWAATVQYLPLQCLDWPRTVVRGHRQLKHDSGLMSHEVYSR